jgi:hypothetical protein
VCAQEERSTELQLGKEKEEECHPNTTGLSMKIAPHGHTDEGGVHTQKRAVSMRVWRGESPTPDAHIVSHITVAVAVDLLSHYMYTNFEYHALAGSRPGAS